MHKILDKHKVIVLAADRYPVNSFTDTPANGVINKITLIRNWRRELNAKYFWESFMRMKCLKLLRENVNKI